MAKNALGFERMKMKKPRGKAPQFMGRIRDGRIEMNAF
jgi:hypothetical protein